MKWHFQFTPHDLHDWDSTEVPVLVDGQVRGRRRKLVVFANRNAFHYVLDRTTGEFLAGKAYAKQTWAKGLDDQGRPTRPPNTAPTLQGAPVWPAVAGANNWYSPTYHPGTGLMYVAVREAGSVYFIGDPDTTRKASSLTEEVSAACREQKSGARCGPSIRLRET